MMDCQLLHLHVLLINEKGTIIPGAIVVRR